MTHRVDARLTVGAVEHVDPARIVVGLDVDAPHGSALLEGSPVPFPRVGGFVLIPVEVGSVVCSIESIGIERAPFPKRPGLKDFGLVDLPFPSRQLIATPLGTLDSNRSTLLRGVATFPTVGDPVRLPSPAESRLLVEAAPPSDRVRIGASLVARGAVVTVDPDRVFGRHLAVLGNTGSGKSCSVAGLVRWSISEAEAERKAEPTARFVVFDPNGEYRDAFTDLSVPVRVLQVPPVASPAEPLRVPAWFWNSSEWVSFVKAAPQAQAPVLIQALRDLRAGGSQSAPPLLKASRNLAGYRAMIRDQLRTGPTGYGQWRGAQDVRRTLNGIASVVAQYEQDAAGEAAEEAFEALLAATQSLIDEKDQHDVFLEPELEEIERATSSAIEALPEPGDEAVGGEDAPLPFDVNDLADHIELLVQTNPSFGDAARYIGSLTMRIRTLLGDSRVFDVVGPGSDITLENWLGTFLGDKRGSITVVDLSLVPSEIVQLVTGVIGRLLFEAIQRHRRLHGVPLPTVLVLEEAHTFVSRRHSSEEGIVSPHDHCVATFEKIAREGRKFGCSLVVSSQRPAELSETVLAQCNTFLLHRLVNDRDQHLVRRLVPDALGGLLNELPALPARHAVLLGWATNLPMLVEIRELLPEHRPTSADPKFWESWLAEPSVDWGAVARSWVGGQETPPEEGQPG